MRNKTCDHFFFFLFFSFSLFLVHFWFSSMGPKPIAAMESIKSEICLPPLPARSTEKLRRANGWNKMKKLWNYILRELSTSFGIHQGRLFNDLCVWGRCCLCLTMDACNARSWPGTIRSGQVLCSHVFYSPWLMDVKMWKIVERRETVLWQIHQNTIQSHSEGSCDNLNGKKEKKNHKILAFKGYILNPFSVIYFCTNFQPWMINYPKTNIFNPKTCLKKEAVSSM